MKSKRIMVCRVCKGDHWTTKCPYKESLEPLQRELLNSQGESSNNTAEADAAGAKPDAAKAPGGAATVGKYIPPGARDGGKRRGETMQGRRGEMFSFVSFVVKYLAHTYFAVVIYEIWFMPNFMLQYLNEFVD